MSEPSNLGDILKESKLKNHSEGYKASRFNVRTEDKDGNLLLLNTFTNKFIRISPEDKAIVIDILRKPESAQHESGFFKYLLEKGFIISSNVNEFRRAEMKHLETIASEGKLSLTIMPNEDCNFRCKYCYESFAKNFMKESVQDGIINYLKKNIKKYNELHIDWFGGEPLTAIPIIEKLSKEMIELCAKNRVRYSAGMTTNGYNLSLDVFRKMQKCKVLSYQITLDGLKEHHDKSRVRIDGKGTFEKIVSNLRDIRDNVKSNFYLFAIRSNVTKPIFDEIDDYWDFFKKEFGNDPRFFSHLHPTGNWGGDSVKSIENIFCSSKDIVSALKRGVEKDVPVSGLYDDQLIDSVCYASKRNNYVIGSDGVIYKCTVAFEDENNHVGLLTEDGIMHIDEDKLAMWITGHESSDKGCQNCFFRPACQGASCPYYRIHTNKSACPSVKVHIKEYMNIVASQSQRIEQFQGSTL